MIIDRGERHACHAEDAFGERACAKKKPARAPSHIAVAGMRKRKAAKINPRVLRRVKANHGTAISANTNKSFHVIHILVSAAATRFRAAMNDQKGGMVKMNNVSPIIGAEGVLNNDAIIMTGPRVQKGSILD